MGSRSPATKFFLIFVSFSWKGSYDFLKIYLYARRLWFSGGVPTNCQQNSTAL